MAGRTPGCRQFLLFHYQQCALADGFPAAASRNLGETDLLMSFFLIGTRSHTHTHTHTTGVKASQGKSCTERSAA